MLVGVNAMGMRPGYGGGEEVFLRRVLAQMEELQRSTCFVIFTDADNDDSFSGYARVTVEHENQMGQAAGRKGVDVLFSPLATAPKKTVCPTVLLAMDLWGLSSNGRTLFGGGANRVKRACQNAEGLIAPSEYVRQQLLDLVGVPLDKVVVAPLGVDGEFLIPHTPIVEKPYILLVGRTRSVRNFGQFMEAFERLSKEIPHSVVIVGQPAEAERDDWGPRVVRIHRLPLAQLASLYQHCAVFVCPSLYEGSGVTVLEAMKAGAPVATGRVGGIAEVAGSSPIYFNPDSVDSMVGGIRRALEETPAERERRIQSGRHVASSFTWEACASKTLLALRRVHT